MVIVAFQILFIMENRMRLPEIENSLLLRNAAVVRHRLACTQNNLWSKMWRMEVLRM